MRHTTKAVQRIVLTSLAPLYVWLALMVLYLPLAFAWNMVVRERVARMLRGIKAKR